MTSAAPGRRGWRWVDLAIAGGQRVSPADAYLTPARHRPNLVVQAGCLVTGLQVRHGRCTGVSYLPRRRTGPGAHRGEVIVCAGAVGSPQLLLLSGIGPAGQLRALGIDPVADLPGVGENLQDHPVVMACYAAPAPLPRSRYNHGEVYAALRSALAGACPDLHLFPILLPVAPAGYPAPPAGFALVAAVVAPDSRGYGAAGIGGPAGGTADRPRFPARADRTWTGWRPGWESSATAAASRRVLPRARHRGAAWAQAPPPAPGCGTSSGGTVGSYYHPAGTCRMGPDTDAGAVVDLQLRVRGITGLRVADASVMPVIPNAPLNATVLAIAEKAAALISGQ